MNAREIPSRGKVRGFTLDHIHDLPPGFPEPIENNWCHSVSEIVKVDFQWTIQYFDFYLECNKFSKLLSSEFSAKELPSLKWSLLVKPSTTSILFTLSYSYKAADRRIFPFRVKYGILNKKGEKVCTAEEYDSTNKLKPENSYSLSVSFSEPDFSTYSYKSRPEYKNSLSDEGHLTFFFEIEVLLDKTTNLSGEKGKERLFSSNNELINHIAGLWETKKLSDVTFNVNGTAFQAHKVILTARSLVFAAMFEQQMKEKLSNQVVITDVDSDVFEQVLRFIYTGQVPAPKMNILAPGLLAAADKYMLENLKKECEKHLANKLSVENCVNFLMLADRHSAPILEQNALNFFRRYPVQVLASDNLSTLAENKKLLAWLCETKKDVFKNSLDYFSDDDD